MHLVLEQASRRGPVYGFCRGSRALVSSDASEEASPLLTRCPLPRPNASVFGKESKGLQHRTWREQ